MWQEVLSVSYKMRKREYGKMTQLISSQGDFKTVHVQVQAYPCPDKESQMGLAPSLEVEGWHGKEHGSNPEAGPTLLSFILGGPV